MEEGFNYWTRQFVCEKLRLSSWQSYKIFKHTPSGRIRSDEVLSFINRRRANITNPLRCLPHDLATMDEIVARFSSSNITAKHIRAWLKRTRCVPPHFRISNKHILFSVSQLEDWLGHNSLPHDRKHTA